MARADTISRLHNNVSATVGAQAAEVKQAEVSEPDPLALYTRSLMRPVRRRFGSPRGAVDAPALMSTMHSSVPVDRGGDLRALAMRDQIRSMLARHAARGGHDQYRGDVQIQM